MVPGKLQCLAINRGYPDRINGVACYLDHSALDRHWIGIAHAVIRTVAIVLAWYFFPAYRIAAVSAVIVVICCFSIVVLELRWRKLSQRA